MQDSWESDSDRRSGNITKEQREEFISAAKQAAAAGDLGRMLEALHQSFVLDGLTRQLASKWRSLPREEVELIIAEAVDILYVAIRNGKKVLNPVAYLWKTSDYKASDYYRTQQNHKTLTTDELEQIPDHSTSLEDALDSATQELDWEEKRLRVIAIVRSLLPRLGQHNVQNVMTYILDALEADCMDISNAEISEALGLTLDVVRQSKKRGFDRLQRIVRQEGLAAQVNDIVNLRRDHSEQSEDEYELV